MKYYHWMSIVIFVFSTNAHAFQSRIEISEQFDNLRMIVFISEKDIKDSPEWSPGIDAPPLTVVEAIKAIRNFNETSKISGAIKEIEIRSVPYHEKHWHYLIKITNDTKTTKYDIYVVLMNGKVIPAIIEPQGYK